MRKSPLVFRSKLGIALVGLLALLATSTLGVHSANADKASKVSKQLREKFRKAMAEYDSFEYEKARQILNSGVLLAKKKRLKNNKMLARIHLGLGIVYFAGFEEPESAKLSFLEAVSIDASIKIPDSYKTKEMDALLEEVKSELGEDDPGDDDDDDDDDSGDDDDDDGDEVDCGELDGIKHRMVDEAVAGEDRSLVAHAAPSLKARKVVLYYRAKGSAEFKTAKMKKSGDCRFSGTIPADAFREDFVHYYIAALNKSGKALASRGSAGLPNIIEIVGAAASDDDDDDNPLYVKTDKTDKKDPLLAGDDKDSLFFSLAIGSGGGYVTGKTEQIGSDVQCCFAPALLHVFPELGFYVTKQTSVALAFRLGFPVGANRTGHAPAAPAGFLHLRHAFASDGEGVHVSAALGAGIIRHTVQLTDVPMDEGDVDTVASGPLFVGTGLGFTTSLGGPIKLLAELNILAGIPILDVGEIEPGTAVQFDANLGLLFAF